MGKTKRVVIVSDLHCGHRCGITHPDYESEIPGEKSLSRKFALLRRTLWGWAAKEFDALEPADCLICNGDAIEGNNARAGGTELLHVGRDEQIDVAAATLKTIRAREIRLTYGTPYHVGQEEDWEKLLADKLGAKIENEIHAEINGLQVCVKHHIGNATSPISAHTASKSAQIRQMIWAAYGQQPVANLIVRSHIHRCLAIIEPGLNFQGWTTPALQGLGGKYGTRQYDGLPVSFGFLELEVENKNRWCVTPHLAPMALQHASPTQI